MSAVRLWKKWADRVSASLVAATGAPVGPSVQLVRGAAGSRDAAAGSALQLGEHDLLRVRNAAGAQIRSLHGHVWITQDGDPRDVVLRPGETFRPDRNARVLVAPLGPAQVVVTSGEPR